MNFWQFAAEDPFVTIVMVVALYFAFKMILRAIIITVRGWPTNPLMDADGDIHYPPVDEEEEE